MEKNKHTEGNMADDKEQYNNVCKKEFENIQVSLDKFYVAIFEGNGEPGLKTKVQMHDKQLQVIAWLGGVVVTAIIGLGVQVMFGK
jgi:hypothetical protein